MDSVELNYKKLGEEGEVIIILHGLFGTLDNWLTIGKKLSEKNYQVYLVDQRNHGKSPHSTNWDYAHMALDIKAFIDKHNISNPLLLGHSMGGKTVMKFAHEYPGIAQKLIIADIAPRYYAPHHEDILKAFRSVDLKNTTTRNDADKMMSSIISEFGIRQFLLKNLSRNSEGFEWKANLDVIEDNIDNVGQALDKGVIETPTLFIRGGQSAYIVDKDIELIEEHFSQYDLKTIPDAGHWLHAEKPQEFMELLSEFIA